MSLEQQVAALVDAANNLTSSVNNKVGEIDTRMDEAEQEFEQFTGLNFPQRVSDARSIKVFIDSINGDDANSGLSVSSPVKSYGAIRQITGGSPAIYDVIELNVIGGSTIILDNAVYAKSEVIVTTVNAAVGDVTTLVQGFYGGGTAGRPMQPFRAPYVEISKGTSGALELHTAEFKEGHVWEEAVGKSSDWMNYVGSMIGNTSRLKLRAVNLKLHDMPLSMVYMGGSMGSYATYQIILGASCDCSVEPAGAGSATFTNQPLLLFCYDNPKIPLDIIAASLSISGNITSVSQLFGNLSLENVRSSFVI